MTFRGYVQLFRPGTLLAPVLGGLGFTWYGAYRYGKFPELWVLFLVPFLLACLNGVSNLWNQVFDIGIDRINHPDRPLPSGKADPYTTMVLGGAVALGSLGLSTELGHPGFTYVMLGILVAAWAYSAPPMRLKRHLWLAPLAIATPRGALGLTAAYLVYGHVDLHIAGIALAVALFVYWGNLTKDIPDVAGDKAGGMRTFAVLYGEKTCATLALAGMGLGTSLLAVLGHYGALLALLHFLAWPLYRGPRGPWRFFYVQFGLNLLAVLGPALAGFA